MQEPGGLCASVAHTEKISRKLPEKIFQEFLQMKRVKNIQYIITRLKDSGMVSRQIAKVLGITTRTLRRWIHGHFHVYAKKRKTKYTEDVELWICREMTASLKSRQIDVARAIHWH